MSLVLESRKWWGVIMKVTPRSDCLHSDDKAPAIGSGALKTYSRKHNIIPCFGNMIPFNAELEPVEWYIAGKSTLCFNWILGEDQEQSSGRLKAFILFVQSMSGQWSFRSCLRNRRQTKLTRRKYKNEKNMV